MNFNTINLILAEIYTIQNIISSINHRDLTKVVTNHSINKRYYHKHVTNNNSILSSYLAVLIEAYRAIITLKSRTNNPTVYDLLFAEFLKQKLGGSIQLDPNAKAFRIV